MNSILNFAKKNFITNKTKSFLTVITIILTTALLTSMGSLYATVKDQNVKYVENNIGNFHCNFKVENDEQFETLKNNVEIEKAGEEIRLGECNNDELGVNRLSLEYMDSDSAQLNNVKLEKGHMPEKANEIVMSQWMVEKLNKIPKMGEIIHLKFMLPLSKEEMWLNKKPIQAEKDFVLCGILKENLYLQKYNEFQGIVSKSSVYEMLNKENIEREISLRFKDIKNIRENIYRVADDTQILHKNVELNTLYINESAPNLEELSPFIIIALVLMLTSVIVIYNIFYVSITQKIQSFGLLSALGATKKQIKKVVIIDGIYNCIIGIPLGILLGYTLSYIICNFVITNFNFEGNFNLKVPLVVILLSIIVSFLTVVISLIRPAKIASKVSPMEAIRFSGYEVDYKKKERKIKGLINIKRLAYLNLWRNKKRTLMTLFSLSMSGMIFIIVSSVIFSMDINLNLKENIQNDFIISSAHTIKDDGIVNPLNEDFINKIKSIDGVTKVQKVNHSYAWFDNSIVSNTNMKVASNKECFSFYGLNDEMINKLNEKVLLGKISLEDLKSKNEVIIVADTRGKYKFSVGDKISLKKAKFYKENNDYDLSESFNEIYEKENDGQYEFNEFTVAAIVNKNIEGLEFVRESSGNIICHQDTFNRTIKDNRPIQLRIDIEDSKYENIKNSLKSLIGINEELTFKSYKESKEELEKEFKSMNIISYGIVSVIAIIGILNLINTRITSIITRKREMGMIEAIGASSNDLNKMLNIEGFYYSFISCLISIIGGLSIGYICFALIKRKATYMVYKFPAEQILILIMIFVIVQIIITYSMKRILNKDSVIEKIKINE